MGLIGRNEPCHCGSGKKYKKCCIGIDEDLMVKGEIPSVLNKPVNRTSHDIAYGIKELVLAQLEQIIMDLSEKHIIDRGIIVNSQDLLKLTTTDDMIKQYLTVIEEVMDVQGGFNKSLELKNLSKRAETLPTLTDIELRILRSVVTSNIAEYGLLSDAKTADYSAMKINNEFAYQAIKLGVPDDKFIWGVTLIVDTDSNNQEKLVNWEFMYSDEPCNNEILIEWKALDKLTDEYHKYTHSLQGLEDESKEDLATVMFQEKAIPVKSRDRASYRGMVTTYTGIG